MKNPKFLKLFQLVLVLLACCLLQPLAHAASTSNPGDPLYCQPNEGTTFLIVNGGAGVFSVDNDCYGRNIANDTTTSITTSQNGSLAGTATSGSMNYIYTPPTSGFTGLDTFTIPVTTVWNSAGGTGSAGGTTYPGGAATFTITLNVLPATTTLNATGPTVVPVPAGSVTGCSANQGSPSQGPTAGTVSGCVTGIRASSTVAPAHGTLKTVGSALYYYPNASYAGSDTFTYQALGVDTDGTTALNSGDITANVTATVADFTFAPATASAAQVIAQWGGSVVVPLSLTPLSGEYPGPITFTVTGLPVGATATFNPTTVAFDAGATTVQMTINLPTSSAVGSLHRKALWEHSPLALGMLLPPLAGGLMWRRRRLALLLTLLVVLGCLGAVSCGGKYVPFWDRYNVTVTATATVNSTTLQHNTNVTLLLQH